MARAKILSQAEQDAVLAKSDSQMAAVMAISFHCGARVGTLAALDWSWLTSASGDLSGFMDVSNAKGGKSYTVALSDRAFALVKALWIERGKPTAGPVVLGAYKSFNQRNGRISPDALRKQIKALYRECGLEASSHSGRRSCATRLLLAGGTAHTVKAHLGHKSIASSVPYVETAASLQAQAITQDW